VEPKSWRVPCTDATGRDREASVILHDDRIDVVFPAPGTGSFRGTQASRLAVVLNEALYELHERERPPR
jgi:hypothetical protein